MSGVQLVKEAMLQNPELAIIFASGQAHDLGTPKNDASITLLKPFTYERLAEAIASAAGRNLTRSRSA